jgi:hypothetical protein
MKSLGWSGKKQAWLIVRLAFLKYCVEHYSATKFRREIFVVSNMETIVSV